MRTSTTRRDMRRARQRLDPHAQHTAASKIASIARQHPFLWQARRIASYQAANGEISPHLLEQQLLKTNPGTHLFYPRIRHYSQAQMQFFSAQYGTRLNRFGLQEPLAVGSPTILQHIDVILIPLVAFDRQGNRLGMGAGFYDRALAFRQHHPSIKRPRLIGLAHHFQEVKSLNAQRWDVPLDAILSDHEFIEV